MHDSLARARSPELRRPGESLLTTREAADFLSVSPTTIQRLARRGTLPACRYIRHLRFRLRDLEDFARAKLSRWLDRPYGRPEAAS